MSVLCYHAVEPGWEAPMSMEPAAFAQHLDWLLRHRSVVPVDEALEGLPRSGRLPRRRVVLTFDDGFASVHEHAFPLLARHRVPATVFLVAKTLDGSDAAVDWVDHPPAHPLRTLDIAQVQEMQDSGIRFESHSLAHADLTSLGYDACVEDLRRGREVLESVLRRPVRLLAYPRGRHDADVRAAARRAGYTHAFALPERREEAGPYAIPRVGVYHRNGTASLRLKLSAAYQPLRTHPAREALRDRVRTLTGSGA